MMDDTLNQDAIAALVAEAEESGEMRKAAIAWLVEFLSVAQQAMLVDYLDSDMSADQAFRAVGEVVQKNVTALDVLGVTQQEIEDALEYLNARED